MSLKADTIWWIPFMSFSGSLYSKDLLASWRGKPSQLVYHFLSVFLMQSEQVLSVTKSCSGCLALYFQKI